MAPWAWRAVRRRHPRPGQEEAALACKALGGCRGCPGHGQEDLGSRPGLSWAGPVPRGQTLLSGRCLSSYKLKGFSALRPCASLNEASLLCLEADGSPRNEGPWTSQTPVQHPTSGTTPHPGFRQLPPSTFPRSPTHPHGTGVQQVPWLRAERTEAPPSPRCRFGFHFTCL